MAAEAETEREVRTHLNTYSFFTGLMTYGAAIAVIVALLVILIIAN